VKILKKSFFYGDVKEEVWREGYDFELPNSEFKITEEFHGYMTSPGFWYGKKRRFERLVENKVFFWDVLSVEFEVGWKVRIEKEVITIIDVIHRLDGSIEYCTDKLISMTTLD
jgi:hypothetical protein